MLFAEVGFFGFLPFSRYLRRLKANGRHT